MKDGHAAFQPEFHPPRVASVEIQNPAHPLAKPFVRVAEDDDMRLFVRDAFRQVVSRRIRMDDVVNKKFPSGLLDDLGVLKRQARVRVAINRRDRRDRFQFRNEGEIADIAGVQDVFNASEQLRDSRVEEIVRVGDDADFHKL